MTDAASKAAPSPRGGGLAVPGLKARPTTYNGIPMRSRLEATFAGLLDWAGVTWEYEPRCFASRLGQYLPDFVITRGSAIGDLPMFVEVKPFISPDIFEDAYRAKCIIESSIQDIGFAVWTPDACFTWHKGGFYGVDGLEAWGDWQLTEGYYCE